MIKLILSLLFISSFLFGEIIIKNGIEKVDDFKIKHFYDDSRKLGIDQIQKKEFNNTISNQFTLGYTKGNNWFRLDISNNSDDEEFIVYINEPFFETASFYYFEEYWKEYESGLFVPLENRIINDTNPAFSIKLKKGDKKTYYIKTYAKLASFGEISIYKEKSFLTHFKLKSSYLYMFYFGGLFIMIVFNLFLYLRLSEKIYLYYVLYTFFYFIFVLIFSGFSIYLGLVSWHYELHLVAPLFIAAFMFFSSSFLEIKYYLPKINRILVVLIWFHLLLAVLNFIDVEPWYKVVSSVSPFVFILLIYSSIYISFIGVKKARYYLIAISIYMITIVLLAFMVNGWIENNDINRYSFLFGSFIEFVLFSLMLANRYYEIKNEKIKMQDKLIDIKEQNELLLENKVKQRTNELLEANKELKTTQLELKNLNSSLEREIEKSIDDIKKKDQLLQHQSRLAQMGEMLSMIAHQWRQPLGAISSAVLSIQTKQKVGKYDLDKKEDREYFLKFLDEKHRNINDYVLYLSDTINDFKNSFKPDTKKEWGSISESVERALYIVGNSLKSHGIGINKNIETNELVFLYQNEMMQVILNILKNSKECFEEKGIKDPMIDISVKKVDSEFIIVISDNGGGIESEIIDNIFDPYFSTKKNKNGTGLGLYISKVMIEDHMGGKINVRNLNKGVLFEIVLTNIEIDD